jgi:hypothetical protein
MVLRDEFIHAGRNEVRLPLVIGLAGYLVAFSFAHGNSIP